MLIYYYIYKPCQGSAEGSAECPWIKQQVIPYSVRLAGDKQ